MLLLLLSGILALLSLKTESVCPPPLVPIPRSKGRVRRRMQACTRAPGSSVACGYIGPPSNSSKHPSIPRGGRAARPARLGGVGEPTTSVLRAGSRQELEHWSTPATQNKQENTARTNSGARVSVNGRNERRSLVR